jgi:integrase
LVIVVGERGQPFTEDGFRSRFFKFLRVLVAKGQLQPGLTFHGLRHTVGKMLAEAGCDTRTIAAVLGHRTEAMARKYSEAENRKRRTTSAIKKLERNAARFAKP